MNLQKKFHILVTLVITSFMSTPFLLAVQKTLNIQIQTPSDPDNLCGPYRSVPTKTVTITFDNEEIKTVYDLLNHLKDKGLVLQAHLLKLTDHEQPPAGNAQNEPSYQQPTSSLGDSLVLKFHGPIGKLLLRSNNAAPNVSQAFPASSQKKLPPAPRAPVIDLPDNPQKNISSIMKIIILSFVSLHLAERLALLAMQKFFPSPRRDLEVGIKELSELRALHDPASPEYQENKKIILSKFRFADAKKIERTVEEAAAKNSKLQQPSAEQLLGDQVSETP